MPTKDEIEGQEAKRRVDELNAQGIRAPLAQPARRRKQANPPADPAAEHARVVSAAMELAGQLVPEPDLAAKAATLGLDPETTAAMVLAARQVADRRHLSESLRDFDAAAVAVRERGPERTVVCVGAIGSIGGDGKRAPGGHAVWLGVY